MKKLMITKNLVVKIQNLTVNHESRPVKSNPDNVHKYIIFEYNLASWTIFGGKSQFS